VGHDRQRNAFASDADGLIAFAQREGVTHVIFGQSARFRWELIWHGSTLDRFLSAVPDAAVQVVPLSEVNGQATFSSDRRQ
jgi:K+-sensing histidine kinase KdpD